MSNVLASHNRKLFMFQLTDLSSMYCLMTVFGGNHALFEAESLGGALEVP